MAKKELTLLQLNDSHGYIEEHWEHFWDGNREKYIKVGGYARMKSYVDSVRQEKDDKVLFFDGGDTFHGTYPVIKSQGNILPDLLNDLGLDGMTGHWDFAYGPKHFEDLVSKLNYPMLAINCYKKEDDQLVFPPYIIKEVDGLKVGVIGIAATIVDKVMPEHFSEGIYFTLGNEEPPEVISELKMDHGVDLLVVLSHLGYPQELRLIKEVGGIDVLLSAHTHNRNYEASKVNDTIIFQSGCHGSFIGRLDLVIENKKIVDYKHELVVMDQSISENVSLKAKIDSIMDQYREYLNEVVGKSSTDLNRNRVLESTMDNLLLQSMLDYSSAQVSFSNGWRYGAPIPKGNITVNDLWNIIPVNPFLSVTKITGQELWDMMEENLERTFGVDPYEQMGGFVKRAMGINLYFKIENPVGQRIQRFFVQGKLIDLEKNYNAVFVTSQGIPEKYGHDRKDLDIKAVDALMKYLERHGTVDARLRESIVAV